MKPNDKITKKATKNTLNEVLDGSSLQNEKIPFWEKPLNQLSKNEWEQLCDGCGLCCIEKLEDNHKIYYTRVACELLDTQTGRCKNYNGRKDIVSDCIELTQRNIDMIDWLPETCAYTLRANNQPLPIWHPLLDSNNEHQDQHPKTLFKHHQFVLENSLEPHEDLSNYLLITNKRHKTIK